MAEGADESSTWLLEVEYDNETTAMVVVEEIIEPWRKKLDLAATVILTFNTVTFMLGMGAAIYIKEVWLHAKRPVGVFIGMVGQFLVMPAIGFALSLAFHLQPYEALGVLMISCSPGGTFSNFFTYWLDGDLALSILMTTCSSIIAFGGMPFNLWLYSKYWIGKDADGSDGMVLPYTSIISSLVFITIPCAVGMIIRHFHKKAAEIITKVSSLAGWIGVVAGVVVWLILYWRSFVMATPLIYLAAFLLPVLGFLMAFTIAKLTCQSFKIARTVGIETGCQNMPVAMSIILLSYSDLKIKGEAMLFPTLYGVLLIIEAIIGISCYQLIKRFFCADKGTDDEDDTADLPTHTATIIEQGTHAEKQRFKV